METKTDSKSEKRDIKLIAVDLDGTLLNTQHIATPRTLNALKEAMANGVKIVIATGKTYPSTQSLISELSLQTPLVCNQGTAIYTHEGTLKTQQTLDVALLRRLIPYAESRGGMVVAYSGKQLLAKVRHPRITFFEEYGEPTLQVVGNFINVLDRYIINKLIIVTEDGKQTRALRWQIDKQFHGELSLVMTPLSKNLEVLPFGSSKGKSVQVVAKELGVPAEKVLAIGDGENDLEMIQFAGWGVAVGNADPKLKAVAKAVVGTNDEEGVAQAIERFVLAPKPVPLPEPEPTNTAESTTTHPQEDSTHE